MTKRPWIVSVLVASLVACLALPGCDALGEPASTESLLVRYATHDNNDNYHASIDVGLVLSLVGYRVSIPVAAEVDIAGEALHGTVHADLSKLGVANYEAEIYGQTAGNKVEYFVGAKVKDDVKWTKGELDILTSLDALSATNLLATAEFNRIALESDDSICYELDIPTTSIVDVVLDILNESELPEEFDADLLRAALEGDKVRSYFTKDCLINAAETVAMGTYSGEYSKGIPVSIKVGAKIKFLGYGKVDVASLAVPDAVRNTATPTSLLEKDPFNILAVLGDDNPLAQRING